MVVGEDRRVDRKEEERSSHDEMMRKTYHLLLLLKDIAATTPTPIAKEYRTVRPTILPGSHSSPSSLRWASTDSFRFNPKEYSESTRWIVVLVWIGIPSITLTRFSSDWIISMLMSLVSLVCSGGRLKYCRNNWVWIDKQNKKGPKDNRFASSICQEYRRVIITILSIYEYEREDGSRIEDRGGRDRGVSDRNMSTGRVDWCESMSRVEYQ